MRFLGWYNVAYGWDFDNVILLELPDYETIDKLEARRALTSRRPPRRGVDVRASPLDVPPRADGQRTWSSTPRPATTRRRHTMDEQHDEPSALGEIATEAGIERASFLTDAATQFNCASLTPTASASASSVASSSSTTSPSTCPSRAEGTFRSRTRYQDDPTGEWVSETEEIASGGELVELYNPADIYAAFAEAARERGRPGALADRRRGPPRGRGHLVREPASSRRRSDEAEDELGRRTSGTPARHGRGRPHALRPGADLPGAQPALRGAASSSSSRTRRKASPPRSGDSLILDDEDERLWYRANGAFEAEVVPGGR